jgi:MFS family permease
MRIEANFSSLKQTSLREHLVRFVLGGAVTAAAGLIARKWGPVIGGLFLAFPAIFPAGATLIEQHEVKRKQEVGRDGRRRGRLAAALDALGAALGAVGLATFAVALWRFLPGHSSWAALGLAVAAWAMVSGGLWILRKQVKVFALRRSRPRTPEALR